MRGASAAILLASLVAAAAWAEEPRQILEKPSIVIGVRIDTPPFSWQDANGGYLGFLVNLCFEAAARAEYPIARTVAVDAARRREILRGEGEPVDVLCDPTTMTIGRIADLRERTELEFSPIIFVANGSYVERTEDTAGRLTAVDAANCVPQQTGERTEPAPEPVWLAAGFVLGTTGEQVVRDAIRARALELGPGEAVCPVEMPTHWAAAKAFCAGDLHYYFGDQDILRSVLAMTALEQSDCPTTPDALPLSYEPYALALSNRLPGFRQDFVMALYELLHHDPAEGRFARSFEGRAMSPFLRTLFRINRLPRGVRDRDDS